MATNRHSPDELSLREFIAAVGSPDEPHGTVSAAAVAGSLGSSLLVNVAAVPQTKSDSLDHRATLIDAAAALSNLRLQLIETIETESAVKLFAARNMPQASDAERSERQAAIQLALRASTEVPLEVMRLCARGLELAASIAAHSARAMSPDAQLGVGLLRAGFDGARFTLETKLSSFSDPAYVTSVVDEIARLTAATAAATRVAASLWEVPPA